MRQRAEMSTEGIRIDAQVGWVNLVQTCAIVQGIAAGPGYELIATRVVYDAMRFPARLVPDVDPDEAAWKFVHWSFGYCERPSWVPREWARMTRGHE